MFFGQHPKLIIDLPILYRLLIVFYLQYEDVEQFLTGDVEHNNPLEAIGTRILGLNLGEFCF